jgi:hypothetical protein
MRLAVSNPQPDIYKAIDLKDCTFKIKDGTTVPLEVTMKIGDGNMTWTERTELEYELDRGDLDTVGLGDQQPMEVRFDYRWDYVIGDSGTTAYDALNQIGNASAWVSTDTSDSCASYAVDLEVEYDPDCGGNDKETYTFPDFRKEELAFDFRNKSISCSGRCNALRPTIVRST